MPPNPLPKLIVKIGGEATPDRRWVNLRLNKSLLLRVPTSLSGISLNGSPLGVLANMKHKVSFFLTGHVFVY